MCRSEVSVVAFNYSDMSRSLQITFVGSQKLQRLCVWLEKYCEGYRCVYLSNMTVILDSRMLTPRLQ